MQNHIGNSGFNSFYWNISNDAFGLVNTDHGKSNHVNFGYSNGSFDVSISHTMYSPELIGTWPSNYSSGYTVSGDPGASYDPLKLNTIFMEKSGKYQSSTLGINDPTLGFKAQDFVHNKLNIAIWGRPDYTTTGTGSMGIGQSATTIIGNISYGASLEINLVGHDSGAGASVTLSTYAGVSSSQQGSLSTSAMAYGNITIGPQREYNESGAYGVNGSLGILGTLGIGQDNSYGTLSLGQGYNFNTVAPEVNNFTATGGGTGLVGLGSALLVGAVFSGQPSNNSNGVPHYKGVGGSIE